jgi:hypothetical protein
VRRAAHALCHLQRLAAPPHPSPRRTGAALLPSGWKCGLLQGSLLPCAMWVPGNRACGIVAVWFCTATVSQVLHPQRAGLASSKQCTISARLQHGATSLAPRMHGMHTAARALGSPGPPAPAAPRPRPSRAWPWQPAPCRSARSRPAPRPAPAAAAPRRSARAPAGAEQPRWLCEPVLCTSVHAHQCSHCTRSCA